ncbi:MAG: NAD(P)/FAD-dependent oxidoreductase [Candidatus Anstonellales archaeon]
MAKVIVVGAGPAGMFASYELGKHGTKVTVIEMGLDIEERKKMIKDPQTAGYHYIRGMGGSGTFSDGKINLHPQIGGNMLEFLPQSIAEEYIEYVDKILIEAGVDGKAKIHPWSDELYKKALKAGVEYIPIKQKHVGSDELPEVVKRMKKKIEKFGVKFLTETEATDVIIKNGNVAGVVVKKKNGKKVRMEADYVILAPGRAGSVWLLEIAKKLGIPYKYGPLDIGVRVEVLNEVMEDVTKINWDPKFHIRTKKYDDFVRTFCTNPYGYVITENYGKFVSVNGHSMKNRKSNNTNFAFLVRVHLTHPVENTTLYGESICKLATTIGGGKAIVQRLGDLKRGRRSTWERIEKSYVEPTNKDVTPGDISMAMPARIVEDIVEGLDKLAGVIPGVNEDGTLLYAPEVKFKSIRLDITKQLETIKVKNLFTAGDGAGVSGGINGAAVTGLIAAREILRKNGIKIQ